MVRGNLSFINSTKLEIVNTLVTVGSCFLLDNYTANVLASLVPYLESPSASKLYLNTSAACVNISENIELEHNYCLKTQHVDSGIVLEFFPCYNPDSSKISSEGAAAISVVVIVVVLSVVFAAVVLTNEKLRKTFFPYRDKARIKSTSVAT
jgi:hypothetical protein